LTACLVRVNSFYRTTRRFTALQFFVAEKRAKEHISRMFGTFRGHKNYISKEILGVFESIFLYTFLKESGAQIQHIFENVIH
jgi:hypothetical protein